MPDISDLLAAASPRELAVSVCLDGTASAHLAMLDEDLARLPQLGEWQPTSLGDTNPDAVLREEIEQARASVAAVVAKATVEFRFRALGHLEFSRLLAAHPPAAGQNGPYDPATFLPALLAACCIEPTLSDGQVEQLLAAVNHGTAQALFDAALAVNEEPSPLPFS